MSTMATSMTIPVDHRRVPPEGFAQPTSGERSARRYRRPRAPSQYLTRGSSKRIADIDGEIDQHIGSREQQDYALDDGIVAPQDRVDGEPTDAGNGEDRLGDDDAADEQRNAACR